MTALLAYSTFAPPTTCLRCGALTQEDTQFTTEALAYNLPQRRWNCAMGHTIYSGLPVTLLDPPAASIPSPHARQRKSCRYCGRVFLAKVNGSYCSHRCKSARIAETDRARRTLRRTGTVLTGEALRQARTVRFPNKAHKALAPYATRPTGLSKAWV